MTLKQEQFSLREPDCTPSQTPDELLWLAIMKACPTTLHLVTNSREKCLALQLLNDPASLHSFSELFQWTAAAGKRADVSNPTPKSLGILTSKAPICPFASQCMNMTSLRHIATITPPWVTDTQTINICHHTFTWRKTQKSQLQRNQLQRFRKNSLLSFSSLVKLLHSRHKAILSSWRCQVMPPFRMSVQNGGTHPWHSNLSQKETE